MLFYHIPKKSAKKSAKKAEPAEKESEEKKSASVEYMAIVPKTYVVPVFSGAGMGYNRIRTLAGGTKVIIVEESGEWGRISPNEWIKTAFVEKI